jgi:hypothetical protein
MCGIRLHPAALGQQQEQPGERGTEHARRARVKRTIHSRVTQALHSNTEKLNTPAGRAATLASAPPRSGHRSRPPSTPGRSRMRRWEKAPVRVEALRGPRTPCRWIRRPVTGADAERPPRPGCEPQRRASPARSHSQRPAALIGDEMRGGAAAEREEGLAHLLPTSKRAGPIAGPSQASSCRPSARQRGAPCSRARRRRARASRRGRRRRHPHAVAEQHRQAVGHHDRGTPPRGARSTTIARRRPAAQGWPSRIEASPDLADAVHLLEPAPARPAAPAPHAAGARFSRHGQWIVADVATEVQAGPGHRG